MEASEDDSIIGRVLRVKVRWDIRKPLMQGVTMLVGEEEKEKWCELAYEYLPDFCYTCGRIGHTDKVCVVQLKEGDMQQFNRKLRYIPEKRRGVGDDQRRS